MGIKDRLEEQILGPQRARAVLVIGMIMNAYYDKQTTTNPQAYVDVVLTDEDGEPLRTLTRVPMLKVGGVQGALPAVGSHGVVGFIDENLEKAFLIGYFESLITDRVIEDHLAPAQLPSVLTR